MQAEGGGKGLVSQDLSGRTSGCDLTIQADDIGRVVGHGGEIMTDNELGKGVIEAQSIQQLTKDLLSLSVVRLRSCM